MANERAEQFLDLHKAHILDGGVYELHATREDVEELLRRERRAAWSRAEEIARNTAGAKARILEALRSASKSAEAE